MQPQPIASVVISVYNGERFLAETLETVWAQSHSDLEVIVVDDGSTDGSAAILAGVRDPRLRVITQINSGPASAARTGVSSARGRYIAFLDQDDLWLPEKLSEHIAFMEARPEVDLSFSWFNVIDEQSREMGIHSARPTAEVSFRELLTDFVIGGTSNVVVRREAMEKAGGPNPSIPGMFDLELSLRIALLRPGNIVPIPRELMQYRRHGQQVTRNVGAMQAEWLQVLKRMRELAPADVASVEAHANANMSRYFSRLHYEARDYAAGLREIGRSIAMAPARWLTDSRNWLTLAACTAGLVLPRSAVRVAERMAGLRRD